MSEPRPSGADVALAEYNALRAELISHLTARGALMALAVTAIGVVGGFVLDERGSNRLLLILPYLVCALGIQSSEHTRRIFLIGAYVRNELWPYLAPAEPRSSSPATTLAHFPNWGETLAGYESRGAGGRWSTYLTHLLLHGLPGGVVYGLGSAVPLVLLLFVNDGLESWPDWLIWGLGVVLTVLYGWLAWQSERPPERSG